MTPSVRIAAYFCGLGRRGCRAAGRSRGFGGLGGLARLRLRLALDGGTDEAILRLGGLRLGHRHRRIVLREHIGHRIGRDEIGQAQFTARQFVQVFPRRHAERERQQIAGSAHVEGVFREAADVALHDHQILRGVARGLGIVGAIAHPDLVHADMRDRRHVTGLARQQQEHAHRLAIGFRRHARAFALRGLRAHGGADRGQRAETAEPAGRVRWNR